MLEKLALIEARYQEIDRLMEEVASDYQRVSELNKERLELEPVVLKARQYRQSLQSLEDARALQDTDDEDMRTLAAAEIEELVPAIAQLEKEIKAMLLPKDPRDDRNVIVEIRAGTGGDEAALFAADLYRMYIHYAEQRKWSIEVLSESETGIGGYKEIIFLVKGKGAYSRLKFESGVHRVQRVPATEASGRIHTSTVTVAVLAEVEEVDIQIPESDIKVDVYRSAGAGGQNVQKNSTAVRITHIPTGMVVACQDERSQLQNRLRALSILRARLYEIEEQKRMSEREASRRSQVGTGERSEKIRTYNYPQSRVTDHRVNLSSYNIVGVLNGDLDLFIDELSMREESDRMSAVGESDDD
ncbi:peptide chain release factor 1 [Levilinea saccharolytica]|uniref:Peptide chain release factor 1 n=1 Tax=Levilinea saccharolytica TaxID=229921 RepID=A0A0P6YET9_9CHLR|nr:peptide chain release factor 1 [Levilinea saccharolytica]KPL90695.1 peptide chain release factor 1 [Levilinea saccharolytica]GAP18348.1 bacterial peptide chain release factor 1 [Levilinea saccharolytica]